MDINMIAWIMICSKCGIVGGRGRGERQMFD